MIISASSLPTPLARTPNKSLLAGHPLSKGRSPCQSTLDQRRSAFRNPGRLASCLEKRRWNVARRTLRRPSVISWCVPQRHQPSTTRFSDSSTGMPLVSSISWTVFPLQESISEVRLWMRCQGRTTMPGFSRTHALLSHFQSMHLQDSGTSKNPSNSSGSRRPKTTSASTATSSAPRIREVTLLLEWFSIGPLGTFLSNFLFCDGCHQCRVSESSKANDKNHPVIRDGQRRTSALALSSSMADLRLG